MSKFAYVCGGFYIVPGEPERKLGLVRPTKGLPYVEQDENKAKDLFRLCQHHSHLFNLDLDSGQLSLIQTGELMDGSNVRLPVILPSTLLDEVKQALAAK